MTDADENQFYHKLLEDRENDLRETSRRLDLFVALTVVFAFAFFVVLMMWAARVGM